MNRLPFKAIIQALLASLVVCIYFLVVAKLQHQDISWKDILLHRNMLRGIMYGFFLFLGNGYLSKWVSGKYPKSKDLGKKMVTFFVLSVSLTLIVVFIVNAFFYKVYQNDQTKNLLLGIYDFLGHQQIAYYFQIAVTSLFISAIFYGFYFYKRFKDYQIKETEQEKQQISAQFESLKNQLDPHFLFNSLNVLNGLIEEDPRKASLFTTDLSKIYRYVLEHKDHSLVSLQAELAFSKAYLNLLSLRFEDGIQINIQLDRIDTGEQILPLSLQLLIENVIKHNVVSLHKPLQLRMYRENDYLIVENNLQRKNVLYGHSGIGLKNIRDRYALLSKRPIKILESATLFRVELPIIQATQT